ncbi:MAG: branched-chain amino acid ABC transporter permease [Sneathiella sp.]
MIQILYFLQQMLNALQVSVIYALLGVSFVLLYGIGNRINLAFGAMAMWSAYLTITIITILLAITAWPALLVVLVGVLCAALNVGSVGFVIQRTIIVPLIKKPFLTLLIATLGLSIFLEEYMGLVHSSREKWLPPLFDQALVLVPAADFVIQITRMQLGVFVTAVILITGLLLLMKQHRFGQIWRACSDDLKMAALCGINVEATLALSFVLASLYTSIAGSLIALLYGSVSFSMGLMIGLKTLFVAVIGGLTSFQGVVVGALILGFFETFWSAYFPIAYRDVASFVVLIFLLILKPEGISQRV